MALTLYYWPAAGRAELCRSIAAAGGLELVEGGPGGDLDKSMFGSPGSIPLLTHGDLKMAQSTAMESYLSILAFPDLSPAMRAVDAQFCCIKEDACAAIYKIYFNPAMKEKIAAQDIAEEMAPVINKWYGVVEAIIPADGFVNGQAYPTAADMVVVNFLNAFHVFKAGVIASKIDVAATFPKLKALSERTAAFPAVAAYLEKSTTMGANVMGLPTQ